MMIDDMLRRRLPHDHRENRALFLTWHLYGSLPRALYPPPGKPNAGKAFVWMDRYLDSAVQGPLYLKQEPLARLVVDALRYADECLHLYQLSAYVVMANHVHMLVQPQAPPHRFLQTVKGYTAREANKLLGRTGQPFWQRECYDHWVRGAAEFLKISDYIENNPVKAGLVSTPEDYPWSSRSSQAQ
jgi:REP element-mobilizing transposase RayT